MALNVVMVNLKVSGVIYLLNPPPTVHPNFFLLWFPLIAYAYSFDWCYGNALVIMVAWITCLLLPDFSLAIMNREKYFDESSFPYQFQRDGCSQGKVGFFMFLKFHINLLRSRPIRNKKNDLILLQESNN